MFYVGLHQPADAQHFDRAFISVNRLRGRKKPIAAPAWIMDSGAFTEIAEHGRYRQGVEGYAEEINRWAYPGSGLVRDLLHSADSMAWSFAARKEGRNSNDWREAAAFVARIDTMPVQLGWGF